MRTLGSRSMRIALQTARRAEQLCTDAARRLALPRGLLRAIPGGPQRPRMLNTGGPCIKYNLIHVLRTKYVYYMYLKSLKDETPLVFSIPGKGAPFMAQISFHNCHVPFIGTPDDRKACAAGESCTRMLNTGGARVLMI